MKSNKGITLTSLVIYVVGILVVTGIIGTFSKNMYEKVSGMVVKVNEEEQYSKVLSYITKDTNSNNITYIVANVDNNDCLIIRFLDGKEHQYINKNGYIYFINKDDVNKKKLIICNNVTNKTGNVFSYSNGKIDVNLEINDHMFSSSFNVKV